MLSHGSVMSPRLSLRLASTVPVQISRSTHHFNEGGTVRYSTSPSTLLALHHKKLRGKLDHPRTQVRHHDRLLHRVNARVQALLHGHALPKHDAKLLSGAAGPGQLSDNKNKKKETTNTSTATTASNNGRGKES